MVAPKVFKKAESMVNILLSEVEENDEILILCATYGL